MDELRILLLGIGLVVLVLIYLWGMRKQIRERIAERRRRSQARAPENEPQLAGVETRNESDVDENDVDVWSEPEIRVIKPAATTTAKQSPGLEASSSESTGSEPPASGPATPTVTEPGSAEPDTSPRSAARERSDSPESRVDEPAGTSPPMSRATASQPGAQPPATDRSRIEPHSSGPADTRRRSDSSARSLDATSGRRRSMDEMTVLLTVMAPSGQQLRGGAIRVACEASDLVLGEGGIWECRTEAAEEPAMIFGIAHLREPGIFAPDMLNALETPGLLLFMRLPGPLDPVPAVDLMIAVAGRLARRLGATVCDQKRNRMSTQAMIRLRAEAAEFESRIQASVDG